jgi:type I restriction enzyme R subunit
VSTIREWSVQEALVDRLTKADMGWTSVPGDNLPREFDEVLIESEVRDALIRLNPVIAERPERADEVLSRLRAVLISVAEDGLLLANEEMVDWLCSRKPWRFTETDDHVPVRLIDFKNPSANRLVVSTEVSFTYAGDTRRFDLVLWVNGIPLVVGETKTPISEHTSWLNGAEDIYNTYENVSAPFFVSSAFAFATEGKEFHMGAIRQRPENWMPWGSTADEMMLPGIENVLRSSELLLNPQTVLRLLAEFTMFARYRTKSGDVVRKTLPRYSQVEATDAIVGRILDPAKRKGLIWHHQGSGKTLTMAYAAAKARRILELDAPTILIVVDRRQLVANARSEFAAVGIPTMQEAKTSKELRRLLKEDARGVIITTIFRFKDAGLLNDRSNIVVMVDEAHRTQEGRLGLDMREALPNAQYIGLTGSPISDEDRNTWELFGDPDDPEGTLSRYSVERSIADGATLPIHIEPRLEDFYIDKEALDEAFEELAAVEGLDEEQAGILARKATRVGQLLKAANRIEAKAADIVEHYRTKIAPLGLKAQVVVYDRELCVLYHEAITRLLNDDEEATVVMTAQKGDPKGWDHWDLDDQQQEAMEARFADVNDPLKFIIVTAKLLTGFDAPIEGVMYLDKPLKKHTLFQAVCRTNRRWTNPVTGQQKMYGLIVDYVGLGNELAKAVAVENTNRRKADPVETDELMDLLSEYIDTCMARFAHVDRKASGFEQLLAAQQVMPDQDSRDEFAADFIRAESLFEFLWPDTGLKRVEVDYRWLARIYKSVMPTDAANKLLWKRLGAKTSALIDQHTSEIAITGTEVEDIAIDADVLEVLAELRLFDDEPTKKDDLGPPTVDEVIGKIEARLRNRMGGGNNHPVWVNLSDRLDALRQSRIDSAQASVEFLKQLLELAREVMEAEKADEEGRLDDIKIVDPDKGALTQILEEYAPEDTPVIIETVVERIDELVAPIRGSGWQESQPGDMEVRRSLRELLRDCGLPPTGDLYNRAYAYLREHY